jgi:hypothetical protein
MKRTIQFSFLCLRPDSNVSQSTGIGQSLVCAAQRGHGGGTLLQNTPGSHSTLSYSRSTTCRLPIALVSSATFPNPIVEGLPVTREEFMSTLRRFSDEPLAH